MVVVVGTAGPTSGEDPDGLSDVSDTGKAGGCPVNVVLDLKTIVKYYVLDNNICISNH